MKISTEELHKAMDMVEYHIRLTGHEPCEYEARDIINTAKILVKRRHSEAMTLDFLTTTG